MAAIPYQTPGVYIEEVASGARPIQAVGTRTAGFVGVAPNAAQLVNEAVPVSNWSDFVRKFASPSAADSAQAAADQQAQADAQKAFNALSADEQKKPAQIKKLDEAKAKAAVSAKMLGQSYPDTHKPTDLSHAVYGFFLNGGSRCYVVNVGAGTGNAKKPVSGSGGSPAGLDLLEQIDEIAIVAVPGYTDKASYVALRDHCDKLADRVGILDGPDDLTDKVMTQLGGETVAGATWEMPDVSARGQISMYVPWLTVSNPVRNVTDKTVNVPPSGHMAGVWARNDATRGVHKAPANEPVRGALSLQRQITHAQQGEINMNNINCIRYFVNEGILVWGARTLTLDPAWRYLNVRRLFNMVESRSPKARAGSSSNPTIGLCGSRSAAMSAPFWSVSGAMGP